MLAGLPAGTITVRRFLAKVWGASVRPSLTASFIFASSAEANTSAGAPCSSCVRRVELPAKFSCTSVPGWSSSKFAFSSPKASVSEEAAKTVKADSPPTSELPDPPHPNKMGRSAATATQNKREAAKTVKAKFLPTSELPDPPHPNKTGRSVATTTQDKSFALTEPILCFLRVRCGFPLSKLLKRGFMLKERMPEVFVHWHRIREQRVGFSGLQDR